jgi:SAM-dependent methyltransferase
MSAMPRYVLGSETEEIRRLDLQAAAIAPATGMLLRAAGIGAGMRVLELGTGLGHVAFDLAELVGPEGAVVAIDKSPELLSVAEERRQAAGIATVRFVQADARSYRAPQEFDAVVARLLLFHLPDAVDVVRHHLGALRSGGTFAAIDFDLGAVRAEPPVALADQLHAWVEAAFRSAGADPRVGTRLGPVLSDAGCTDVTTFGIQAYLPPGDPRGPGLLGGVTRSLAPQMIAAGIATEEELGADTVVDRLTAAARNSIILLPTVVGAWGRRDGAPED